MPKYRFEFRENFAKEELESIELENDALAKEEAIRTAREILAEGVLEGLDRTGWAIRVYDEQGLPVTTIEFSQLVEKRGNLE
jgi:hypothetical protein